MNSKTSGDVRGFRRVASATAWSVACRSCGPIGSPSPVRYVPGELKARNLKVVEDDVVDRANVLCHDSPKLAASLIKVLALGR